MSPSSSTAPSPFPCNLNPDERAAQIRELMATVSDDTLFDDPSTPQAKALDWITNEDAINPVMCPNMQGTGCSRGRHINPMIQRYILAVFYFATGGGTSWAQCNAPADFYDEVSVGDANARCNRGVTPYYITNDRVGDTSTDAWLGPVNECEWGGVACWGADKLSKNLCIEQLEFENNGLSGELASEIGELHTLRILILERGTIGGTIPSQYGELERLRVLNIDSNEITGTIPDEIYGLHRLQHLVLNDNNIKGTISPKIGDLSDLRLFQIDDNQLSGTFPSEMGQLENLWVVSLKANDLTGTIPSEMGQLENLWHAILNANNLIGTMPPEVCALRNDKSPPGELRQLDTDCSGADPEVTCSCCTSCTPDVEPVR